MENEYYKEITQYSFIDNKYSENMIDFTERDRSILENHFSKTIFTIEKTSLSRIFIRIEKDTIWKPTRDKYGDWILVMLDEWYVYRNG